MFDPECQNIDCPQCLRGKIYFDREMGYYCMLCGHEFGAADVEMLIEKTALTTNPARKSKCGQGKSVVQIRELPAETAETKHISRNIPNHGKTEH